MANINIFLGKPTTDTNEGVDNLIDYSERKEGTEGKQNYIIDA